MNPFSVGELVFAEKSVSYQGRAGRVKATYCGKCGPCETKNFEGCVEPRDKRVKVCVLYQIKEIIKGVSDYKRVHYGWEELTKFSPTLHIKEVIEGSEALSAITKDLSPREIRAISAAKLSIPELDAFAMEDDDEEIEVEVAEPEKEEEDDEDEGEPVQVAGTTYAQFSDLVNPV